MPDSGSGLIFTLRFVLADLLFRVEIGRISTIKWSAGLPFESGSGSNFAQMFRLEEVKEDKTSYTSVMGLQGGEGCDQDCEQAYKAPLPPRCYG